MCKELKLLIRTINMQKGKIVENYFSSCKIFCSLNKILKNIFNKKIFD